MVERCDLAFLADLLLQEFVTCDRSEFSIFSVVSCRLHQTFHGLMLLTFVVGWLKERNNNKSRHVGFVCLVVKRERVVHCEFLASVCWDVFWTGRLDRECVVCPSRVLDW